MFCFFSHNVALKWPVSSEHILPKLSLREPVYSSLRSSLITLFYHDFSFSFSVFRMKLHCIRWLTTCLNYMYSDFTVVLEAWSISTLLTSPHVWGHRQASWLHPTSHRFTILLTIMQIFGMPCLWDFITDIQQVCLLWPASVYLKSNHDNLESWCKCQSLDIDQISIVGSEMNEWW